MDTLQTYFTVFDLYGTLRQSPSINSAEVFINFCVYCFTETAKPRLSIGMFGIVSQLISNYFFIPLIKLDQSELTGEKA